MMLAANACSGIGLAFCCVLRPFSIKQEAHRMAKYRSITALLQRLAPVLAAAELEVSEQWRDDEQALGLRKPGVPGLAAYVAAHGQPTGCYALHLQYPDFGDVPFRTAVSAGDGIPLDRMLDVLAIHFDFCTRTSLNDGCSDEH
jgi:hypothetical protein